MADLIDRAALLEKTTYLWCEAFGYEACVCCDDIKDAPAVDAVEVIRCKECKHWGGVPFGNICRRWSAPLEGMKNCTKPGDFCSYGERRPDETD